MFTKLRLLCTLACFFCIQVSFYGQCDNFYSKVTYALNHTKKGMSATNFEHQMYYAERALTAVEKGKAFTEGCDCEKAEDKTLDVMETLDKAIEPIDWEAGRFFTKKAMKQINELITILDNCTRGVTFAQSVEDSDSAKLEHQAQPNETTEVSSSEAVENEMIGIFEKHAHERFTNAEKAINELIEFSNTIQLDENEVSNNPDGLQAHQKAYLEKVKNLLEDSGEKAQY